MKYQSHFHGRPPMRVRHARPAPGSRLHHATCCRTLLTGIGLTACVLAPARAAEIISEGVLGNSGYAGNSLVRFAPRSAPGMGVVCDQYGSLWDRAGRGRVNRYAPDGRLIASYSTPEGSGSRDAEVLTLAGRTVVLLLGNQLYGIDVDAPAGTAAKPLGIEAARLSLGAIGSKVAILQKGQLSLVDISTGRVQPVAPLADCQWLAIGPDGSLVASVNYKLQRYQPDGPASSYVLAGEIASPGERPQWLDGYWWGHGWHGTIRRHSRSGESDPGVVLGGASGSFIGHLEQNSDVVNGRGLARLREGLYAVSGLSGTMNLLDWSQANGQFTIVRRIGAINNINGLGLDKAGNVFAFAGSWKWNDSPAAPLRNSVNAPDGIGISQAVMLPDDKMIAPARLWGRPGFYFGSLQGEVSVKRYDDRTHKDEPVAATAFLQPDRQRTLLAVQKNGVGRLTRINPDSKPGDDLGIAELKASGPVTEWTALTTLPDGTIWAAVTRPAGGALLQLKQEGSNFVEVAHKTAFEGPGDTAFGARLHLTCDAGRIWISDSDKHRVLCLDGSTWKLLAQFGGERGDSSQSLDTPRVIAARGDRAVVFDSGNQRLMKLRLR